METLICIHSRRSYGVLKADPVSKEKVEALLGAAVQAPNHYKVRPWQFIVISGIGLSKLGDVMAKSLSQKTPDLPADALDKERAKPLRAPLIIAVGVSKPSEPKISEVENICASAAACQNILLAAHELGLSAIWRTGPSATDPMVKEFLGLGPEQHLIGFIYIGYPDKTPEPAERPSYQDRTTWIQ